LKIQNIFYNYYLVKAYNVFILTFYLIVNILFILVLIIILFWVLNNKYLIFFMNYIALKFIQNSFNELYNYV